MLLDLLDHHQRVKAACEQTYNGEIIYAHPLLYDAPVPMDGELLYESPIRYDGGCPDEPDVPDVPAVPSPGARVRYMLPIKPWKRRPREEDEALLLAVLN